MKSPNLTHIHRITALIVLTAIFFILFFQVNKHSPFVVANPFAVDPYDAVGSIAIQVALLISLLTYARVLRNRHDPTQNNMRLVLHGNVLVLAAIFITLCSDAIAVFVHPMPPSLLLEILRIELVTMFVLILACGFGLWIVFRNTPTPLPPADLTPADAIDDLWSLVRVPVVISTKILPPAMVAWVSQFNSDYLFSHVPWLNPLQFPWRFAALMGLLAGLLLLLAQLQEGLPPTLGIGLLVAGIFISVEIVAMLLGLLVFGGYLGLRPALKRKI